MAGISCTVVVALFFRHLHVSKCRMMKAFEIFRPDVANTHKKNGSNSLPVCLVIVHASLCVFLPEDQVSVASDWALHSVKWHEILKVYFTRGNHKLKILWKQNRFLLPFVAGLITFTDWRSCFNHRLACKIETWIWEMRRQDIVGHLCTHNRSEGNKCSTSTWGGVESS